MFQSDAFWELVLHIGERKILTEKAIEIVKEAGRGIMDDARAGIESSLKEDGSMITSADKRSNNFIIEKLKALTPDIAILSEESSAHEQQVAMRAGTYWALDPLDATRTYNDFANGDKERIGFSIQLSLVIDGKPTIGVAHFPAIDDGTTYYTAGDKAYKNNQNNRMHLDDRSLKTATTAAVRHLESKDEYIELDGKRIKTKGATGAQRNISFIARETDMAIFTNGAAVWDIAATAAIIKSMGGQMVQEATHEPVKFSYDEALSFEDNIYKGVCVSGVPKLLMKLGYRIDEPALIAR